MIGLVFFGAIGLWIMLVRWFTRWLFSRDMLRFLNRKYRFVLMVLFWVGIHFVLIADEIVGSYQFRSLCQEKARLEIDPNKIKGKFVSGVLMSKTLHHAAIPIRHVYISYRDVDTDEEYASHNTYHAGGGRLMRSIGFWGPMQPLIIYPASCFPSISAEGLDKQYGFFRSDRIKPHTMEKQGKC
jgi:hypothetical protein